MCLKPSMIPIIFNSSSPLCLLSRRGKTVVNPSDIRFLPFPSPSPSSMRNTVMDGPRSYPSLPIASASSHAVGHCDFTTSPSFPLPITSSFPSKLDLAARDHQKRPPRRYKPKRYLADVLYPWGSLRWSNGSTEIELQTIPTSSYNARPIIN